MNTNFNLYNDLISDFHNHDKYTREQLALVEPIAANMKSGSIQRLLNSWFLIFLEIIAWIFVALSVAAVVLTDKIYPFSFLNKISFNALNLETYGEQDFEILYLGTKILFVIIAILFFIITRMVSSMRRKNKMLGLAAKNMKKIGEHLLKQKTHIESMYNKYPYDLPKHQESIQLGTAQLPQQHDDIIL